VTRYELLERIGAGGMAEIFRGKAVAAGGFEKPVAIKRILPHLSQDRRFVELLIAEAKILSQLRHRNIVQIFDVGLGDDNQHFLVMEFVDGMDLGKVQRGLEGRRKRLPLDLVLHIGAEVCEALQHAHAAPAPDGTPMRLVHRDVSPSNVLISRSGEVKLTDFGIAKRPEEQTGQHGVRGKFAYISPEQAENRHVDARSDVFSVGVLLYELALGHRLFSHLADFDALKAVRECKIPAPSDIDPALSREVEQLLRKALARDPAQRFATAGELGAKLRSVRYSLETTAGDPATELARIVASLDVSKPGEPPTTAGKAAAGKRRRAPSSMGFEAAEPTVVRIRTADAFAAPDGDSTAILRAKQLLDKFEEEETRMARVGRGPFPTGEVTLDGRPQGALDIGDSGALADEETRVMSSAQARRVLALDDESTQTVTQRRPGAEVAAALAGIGQAGPAPTIGASAPPPPPAALLRAAMTGAPARGTTGMPRPARTPRPEPAGSPVPVESSLGDRGAAPTERDSFDRREPTRRPAPPPVATPAPTAPRPVAAAVKPPPVARIAAVTSSRRRILLAVAAIAVATGSFLAASAVLGGDGTGGSSDAGVPAVVPAAIDAGGPAAPAANDAGPRAGAKEPAAKEPAAKEPVAKEPAAKEPVAKEPAAKPAAAKKPAAKPAPVKKPAAKPTKPAKKSDKKKR
jgi:tRNA A-37 threonylcarbamoyl transferase component Bud32